MPRDPDSDVKQSQRDRQTRWTDPNQTQPARPNKPTPAKIDSAHHSPPTDAPNTRTK